MKNITFLSVLIMLALSMQFCRNKAGRSQQDATDLMSARTLGLAYLEEFKLEEAEKEFLKFIDLSPEDKFGYANLGLTYLRMGNYPEAEKQLKKAMEIDSADADIRLILSTVYKMNDQPDNAIEELRKALSFAPDHVKVLYEISELYSDRNDAGSLAERKDYLQRLIKSAPGNIVPKLNLTEILLKEGSSDGAVEQLEIIRKQFPEFPKESVDYYDKALAALRQNNMKEATIDFTIFHNYLKVTPTYQAGMMDLKGPGGSLIGFPLITFDRQTSSALQPDESILDVIKFTEVSVPAGLGPHNPAGAGQDDFSFVEAADYDGDEDIDLYVSGPDPSSSSFTHRLYNNNSGLFTDVTAAAGLNQSGKESSAVFGDYDNDGFLDLYIMRDDGDILYRNDGKGKFVNVTSRSAIGSKTGGNAGLFVDADHDGDLDLFEARSNDGNLLERNNSDGTFTEQAEKMNLAGRNLVSSDAAFGDFDEDGDIDIIVSNENQSNLLYSNSRQGIFEDVTQESGLESRGRTAAIAVSDYNNDGFLDLFTGSENGAKNILYKNDGTGKFSEDKGSTEISRLLEKVNVHDAAFFDFDNDGFADLFIAGENIDKNGKGVFLLHNDGKGNFSNVSHLIPEEINSGTGIAVFDYNDDGDNDIALARPGGAVALLRNDGGNNNHYVKIRLVGLRAGSAKNNHFGIGAKIEIRAGDLYQTMVVTNPAVMFGLGNRSAADVVRITWTNGVPQNLFMPAADQALIEAQTLKGSCPFLYAWDGQKFEFIKDIMWRSGLGMPLGIMGGNTAYA
ncbi:MAG TPA: FG-GAP-like repeat-containing protein, partial [Bacteroidales bacterium]|nr:FG-GAP-like repeat-containing protein [Bacteroidales bacterium]